jgi:hypothetical protein
MHPICRNKMMVISHMADKSSITKDRLIKGIYDFQLKCEEKITIQKLCQTVGISRQAFNRYYPELKPFVNGKKPIGELEQLKPSDINNLLLKTQERLSFLQNELDAHVLKSKVEKEEIKKSYITSLMLSDLVVADVNELQDRIQKQALHKNILINEIQKLKIELAETKAKQIEDKNQKNLNKVVIDFPADDVYQRYFLNKNTDELEDFKEQAFSKIIKKINQINNIKNAAVILYLERYLSSFEKFSESFSCERLDLAVIVRAPIFSRTEINLFIKKLTNLQKIIVCYPYSTNEITSKAQRHFMFRNIPEIELNAADNLPQPLIQDGYDQVIVFQVKQGD